MLVAKAKRTVKNNNRSNKQKQKKLCTCSTLFCTFICRCFARQQSETSRNSLVTLLWRKCRTCSCSLFFQCRSFFPGWPLTFLIFSSRLQIHIVLPTKKWLHISRPSSLSLFFSVFLFLYLPNLWTWQLIWANTLDNTDTETISAFRFVFIDSLGVSGFTRVGWLCDFPPKKPWSCIWVAIPVDWVTLVCL